MRNTQYAIRARGPGRGLLKRDNRACTPRHATPLHATARQGKEQLGSAGAGAMWTYAFGDV